MLTDFFFLDIGIKSRHFWSVIILPLVFLFLINAVAVVIIIWSHTFYIVFSI